MDNITSLFSKLIKEAHLNGETQKSRKLQRIFVQAVETYFNIVGE